MSDLDHNKEKMSSIDREKKDLYDSIPIIAEEDNYRLLFELMKSMYERQELCRAAINLNMNNDIMDIAVAQLKIHNKNIKHLLRL